MVKATDKAPETTPETPETTPVVADETPETPETTPVVKWPIDAKTAARMLRADERFDGRSKLTDKTVRRLVREHDVSGMDDDRYTRHLYDAATFDLIASLYYAPRDRRAAQVESDAPESDETPDA